MSDALAHYSFLPWMRQGIGNKIAEKDAQGVPAGTMAVERAEIVVGLTVEGTDANDGSSLESTISKTLKMVGPPDILGIADNVVVRMEPKPRVNNYESNGLPYIEFYKEDFLWAYTPATAGSGSALGRLTPWLALICLKDDEFELKTTSEGRSYIVIDSGKISEVFHDETQHWAWGHVHLSTELVANSLSDQVAEVTSELDENPDTGVCRLLCPRKLIKETQYTAFLIPAFETGRLAGLEADYTGVPAQKMSWGKSEDYASKLRGTEYPVYKQWTFRTGLHGDFESLARILKAVVSDPELGKRDMYIAEAGYGLEDTNPDSQVLGIEGALKPPGFLSDAWTNGSGDVNYKEHLRKLLNLSVDNSKKQTDRADVQADSLAVNPFYSASLGDDPIVTPHIYGRWHALIDRLQNGANFPWVNTLNLDPRNRAAAGLGLSIVQKNQENYMQRAWKQVEQINTANDKIRKAAASRLINNAIYFKRIKHSSGDKAVRLTSPMHSFVLNSGKTVQNQITTSLIPNASQSAAFKKVTRPGKKLIKQMNALQPAKAINKNVTENFNEGFTAAAEDKKNPLLAIDIAQVSTAINTSITNYQANDTAMAQQAVFDVLMEESSFTGLETVAKKAALKTKIDDYPDLSVNSRNLAKGLIDGITSSIDGGESIAHEIKVEETPYKAVFGDEVTAKLYQNILITRETGGAVGVLGRATLLQDLNAFGNTFSGFQTDIISNMIGIPKASKLTDLPGLSGNIAALLDPKNLIISRISSGISLNILNPLTGLYEKKNLDKLKPVMAYPKFDDPMFRDLKLISQEYILPNIDKVPENSITLMETNQKFIEAFMAGINHEMSRELLWREFPTDQRGTYFRQFWDISDNITEADREKKYDIKKMHEWQNDLGDHSSQVKTSPDDSPYLVLLIRGELLKKYPNTQVYAQKAQFKNPAVPDAPRALADASVEGNVKMPVFMAELDPDIFLFGFDLDKHEAKGDSNDASSPGWFFVMRERPGQIRFGLDDWTPTDPDDPLFPTSDPANWNDLSWEHLVTGPEDLENYHIDTSHAFAAGTGSENSPLAVWGKNAADMAFILYQNPVLFARHGQEMLPD